MVVARVEVTQVACSDTWARVVFCDRAAVHPERGDRTCAHTPLSARSRFHVWGVRCPFEARRRAEEAAKAEAAQMSGQMQSYQWVGASMFFTIQDEISDFQALVDCDWDAIEHMYRVAAMHALWADTPDPPGPRREAPTAVAPTAAARGPPHPWAAHAARLP